MIAECGRSVVWKATYKGSYIIPALTGYVVLSHTATRDSYK